METSLSCVLLSILVLQMCRFCIASRVHHNYTQQTGQLQNELHDLKLISSDHKRKKQADITTNRRSNKTRPFFKSQLITSFHNLASLGSNRSTFLKREINATSVQDRNHISQLHQTVRSNLKKNVGRTAQPNSKLFQDPVSKSKLFFVAALLARHKYTGYDPRENDEFGPKNFHRHFPIPMLAALHLIVSNFCEKDFHSCVEEISNYTEPRDSTRTSFESKIERFEFLTTASYYMCWYAMKRTPDLLQLDNASRKEFQCLDFNTIHYNRKKHTSTQIGITRPTRPSVVDVRLSDFKRPYLCAELSFCPDFCYGRNTQGVVKDLRRDEGNPCFGLQDSWCTVDPKKNVDFSHLMRNDVNFTCRCEVEHVGFIWNKELGLCLDVDECEEGLHTCADNMICQNTVGSFQCICSWGYIWMGQSCTEVTKLQNRVDVHSAK